MVLETADVYKAIEYWLNNEVLYGLHDYRVNYVLRRKGEFHAEIINTKTGKKVTGLPLPLETKATQP